MNRTILHNREIFFMLQKSLFFFDRLADQALRTETASTLAQFHVLVGIFMHGTASQQVIAEMLQNTQASVSRQVSILLRKKFITRTQNPKNKREYHLVNTALGTEMVKKSMKVLDLKFEDIFDVIPMKDKECIIKSLSKVIHKVGIKHAHLDCDLAKMENTENCVLENLKKL